MDKIKQLFWIFLFSFLGEIVSLVIPFAVPGSVLGMILLFLALHFNVIKIEQVETVGTWLTDNMAIFFIPAGVALMTNFGLLGSIWLQLLLVMIISTAAMIAFVGIVVQFIMKRSEKKEAKNTKQSAPSQFQVKEGMSNG